MIAVKWHTVSQWFPVSLWHPCYPAIHCPAMPATPAPSPSLRLVPASGKHRTSWGCPSLPRACFFHSQDLHVSSADYRICHRYAVFYLPSHISIASVASRMKHGITLAVFRRVLTLSIRLLMSHSIIHSTFASANTRPIDLNIWLDAPLCNFEVLP